MNALTRIFKWLYTRSLNLYPAKFRANFSEEMQSVFAEVAHEAENNPGKLLAIFGCEIRDWPGAVWREHLYAKKGLKMNQNHSTWQPPTIKEILATLALFAIAAMIFAIFPAIAFVSGGSFPEWLKYTLIFGFLAVIPIAAIFGIGKGFPRWSIPYLGVILTIIVFTGPSVWLWELIYSPVLKILGGRPTTLLPRVIYQALMSGFSWFLALTAAILLILLLMVWPRTRQFACRIRADWTLLSFLLYGGVVFAILLAFDEYHYIGSWLVAGWACMAVGAWVYLKSGTPRKRILALLAGVTLAYWIAAVGKWVLVPLQTWGAFHGYDYETYRWFEFWRTLAEWGWVMFFMSIPALLMLIPRAEESDSVPDENLAPHEHPDPDF